MGMSPKMYRVHGKDLTTEQAQAFIEEYATHVSQDIRRGKQIA
jgi:hypothetical protein